MDKDKSGPERICVDCKWSRPDIPLFWMSGYRKCSSPHLGKDLVSGNPNTSFCLVQRNFDHLCGPSGMFWKSKKELEKNG